MSPDRYQRSLFMEVLVENLTFLTWQQVLMWLIGGTLIYSCHRQGDGAVAAAAHGLRRDSGEPAQFRRGGGHRPTLFQLGIAGQ